ncbi:MAG: dihydrodipicolinate synthase family protein [Fimbriimonadales bacterium]|nr:dihydrodipicolinate synthase family protein [Fimbriimonadales bacterium]
MEPVRAGVHVAAITPFTAEGTIDAPYFARLLAHFEAQGAQGVVVAGSTGEGPSLSAPEKVQLYELAVAARGQLQITAGILACSLDEALYLARQAHKAGCHALMVAPPFYYPAALEGLIAFYRAVLDASRLPVILYNIPQRTRVRITRPLVDALLEHPNLHGIKDSSGSLRSMAGFLRYAPRLRVWVGEEKLLSHCLQRGGAGSISGLANVFLPTMARLCEAFQRNEPCDGLQQRIDAAADALDAFPAPANFKHALTHFGFPPTHARPPLRNLTDDQRAALDAAWNRLA